MENVHTNLPYIYMRFFVFELGARTARTDRRTDGRMDGQDP